MLRLLLTTGLASALVGCSALGALESTATWKRWSAERGGVLRDPVLQARAERALRALRDHDLRQELSVRVLDQPLERAWAWRSGHLFLTRGLLEALDDLELAAAIAHELGHLLARSRPDRSARDESAADELGCEILARNGIPPGTMARMLRTLRDRDPGALAGPLHARIAHLERVRVPAPRLGESPDPASPTAIALH